MIYKVWFRRGLGLRPLVRGVDERSVEKVMDEIVQTGWSTNAYEREAGSLKATSLSYVR